MESSLGITGVGVAGMIVILVISYLIGNISPAILISKGIYGKDVRTLGSGNAGTTNMLRNFGKKAAAATLLIDALKGVPCVLLGNWIIGLEFGMWCGLAAILGHIWPVCFGFKGGKGVATILGTALAVAPKIALICIAFGLLVMIATKRISPGSLLGTALFPVLVFAFNEPVAMVVWSLVCVAIIWWKHRENIVRILKGEEPKVSFKK